MEKHGKRDFVVALLTGAMMADCEQPVMNRVGYPRLSELLLRTASSL